MNRGPGRWSRLVADTEQGDKVVEKAQLGYPSIRITLATNPYSYIVGRGTENTGVSNGDLISSGCTWKGFRTNTEISTGGNRPLRYRYMVVESPVQIPHTDLAVAHGAGDHVRRQMCSCSSELGRTWGAHIFGTEVAPLDWLSAKPTKWHTLLDSRGGLLRNGNDEGTILVQKHWFEAPKKPVLYERLQGSDHTASPWSTPSSPTKNLYVVEVFLHGHSDAENDSSLMSKLKAIKVEDGASPAKSPVGKSRIADVEMTDANESLNEGDPSHVEVRSTLTAYVNVPN